MSFVNILFKKHGFLIVYYGFIVIFVALNNL